LNIVYFATYLSSPIYHRGVDYDAHDFIMGIKGNPFRGYANVPVLGRTEPLENSNLDDTIGWFAELVADYFSREGVTPPLDVVPVPNSSTTVSSTTPPRTARLADAIARQIGGGLSVHDVLRWKVNLGSARSGGGPRDPQVLYDNIAPLSSSISWGSTVVLVDDVLTSGGHLKACAAFLRAKGASVELGVCAGRTVYAPPANPFAVVEEDLEDFEPA
jgi:hypothetical protein